MHCGSVCWGRETRQGLRDSHASERQPEGEREREAGGEGGREREREIRRGPVTGNERWHFKEEAEFHLQLP